MRTTLFLTAITAFFLSSCSTGNKMQSSVPGDDLYMASTPSYVQSAATENRAEAETSATQNQYNQEHVSPDNSTSEKYTDENGTTYVTNNYYDSYSSQLDRWYNPVFGFSYFSPYYTGMSLSMPFYYSPGFSFSLSFGFGFGYPWYGGYYPGYNPYYAYNPWYNWYNPWYYPYYGCGYYGSGYYGNNYCGGGYYGGGYYGDGGYYGSGNNYYGPHGSASSNTSGDGVRTFKMADDNSGSAHGTVVNVADPLPTSGNPAVKSASAPAINHSISGKSNSTNLNSPGDVKSGAIVLPSVKQNSQNSNPRINSAPASVPEIKSTTPPVRSNASPAQNNNPRIAAAPAEGQQQKPAVYNGFIQLSSERLIAEQQDAKNYIPSLSSTENNDNKKQQPLMMLPEKKAGSTVPNASLNYQPPQKSTNQKVDKHVVYEQPKSTNQHNAGNDNHPSFNNSAPSRSSYQESNSRSSGGGSRGSENSPRRK